MFADGINKGSRFTLNHHHIISTKMQLKCKYVLRPSRNETNDVFHFETQSLDFYR